MRRVSMAVRGLEPAAADVLAATDGGGALAAFFNSSKGAFERTRDEFFVCAGCCAASGSSRCSLRATSYDDHGVYGHGHGSRKVVDLFGGVRRRGGGRRVDRGGEVE